MIDENLKYIRKGKTGCVFATILAKNPEKVGWKRVFNPEKLEIPEDAFMVSFIFEGRDKEYVRNWALQNGMYEEKTSDNTIGLRYKNSWVQYFGQDSHVKTRQTPISELLFCVKLPKKYYYKVGFKGVLHLAHASIEHIKDNVLDFIWDRSFVRSKQIVGHKLGIEEAAKTTFKNE